MKKALVLPINLYCLKLLCFFGSSAPLKEEMAIYRAAQGKFIEQHRKNLLSSTGKVCRATQGQFIEQHKDNLSSNTRPFSTHRKRRPGALLSFQKLLPDGCKIRLILFFYLLWRRKKAQNAEWQLAEHA